MNRARVIISGLCSCLSIGMFVMAIRHRHDLSGVVWAILWVGEQIHLPSPSISTLFREDKS